MCLGNGHLFMCVHKTFVFYSGHVRWSLSSRVAVDMTRIEPCKEAESVSECISGRMHAT